MRDFQKRRKIRKLLYSPRAVLIFLVVVVIFGQGAWGVYRKERESRRNLERVSEELNRAKEREGLISKEIEYLNTERGVEEEIREKFSVTKPGEEMVVIIEGNKDDSDSGSKKRSFFFRLWSSIKGVFD